MIFFRLKFTGALGRGFIYQPGEAVVVHSQDIFMTKGVWLCLFLERFVPHFNFLNDGLMPWVGQCFYIIELQWNMVEKRLK